MIPLFPESWKNKHQKTNAALARGQSKVRSSQAQDVFTREVTQTPLHLSLPLALPDGFWEMFS